MFESTFLSSYKKLWSCQTVGGLSFELFVNLQGDLGVSPEGFFCLLEFVIAEHWVELAQDSLPVRNRPRSVHIRTIGYGGEPNKA